MRKDKIKRKYSIIEVIKLGYYLFRTKLICPKVRLFRFPIVIRGGANDIIW